jgi:hypothetical protein
LCETGFAAPRPSQLQSTEPFFLATGTAEAVKIVRF